MRDLSKFEYLTYEYSQYGGVSVHGWDEYPRNSVLAGQARKTFLDSFESAEEAEEAYPDAEASHKFMQPQVSLNHLPDDGDW